MNKDERIAIRMTEGERNALQRAATLEQRHESEMVREMMREGLQRRGLWPMPENAVHEAAKEPTQ